MRRFLFLVVYFLFPIQVFAGEYRAEDWNLIGSDTAVWVVSPDKNHVSGYTRHRSWESMLIADLDSSDDKLPQSLSLSFQLKPQKGVDRKLVWHYLDEDNYYQLHFSETAAVIRRYAQGHLYLRVGRNYGLNQGETYNIELKAFANKIQLHINDELIIDEEDWTLQYYPLERGTFGVKLAPGTVVPVQFAVWDFLATDLEENTLPIPFWRQTDLEWANDLYDHADRWAKVPTMARWGCATTSAAMAFVAQGHTYLHDGITRLTPRTLNNWLRSQPDGYVGNGLLNWLALTRLSRELQAASPEKSLPKFEFERRLGSEDELLAQAQDFLKVGGVPIGHVPGHFFVITSESQQSPPRLSIHDPFYEVEEIPSHELGQLQSLRLLRPSQTDQSYWLFLHQQNQDLKLWRVLTSGERVEVPTQSEQVYLEEATQEDHKEAPKIQSMTWVEKPSAGKFFLELNGTDQSQESHPIEFWSYSRIGAGEKQDIWFSQTGSYHFSYDKENNATALVRNFVWKDFLQELEQSWQNQKITEKQVYQRLKKLGQLAQKNPDERYIKRAKKLGSHLAEYIQSPALRSFFEQPNP